MDGHRQTNLSREMMNESGDQLPSTSQRNGLPSLTQVHSVHWRNSSDISEIRKIMLLRTEQFLVQTQKMSPEILHKLPEIARKIDDFFFQMVQSKEEYMNMKTIEHRLQICLQWFRRFGQQKKASGPVKPSSSIGTMIPTPGVYQTSSRNALTFSHEDNHVNTLNAVQPPTTAFTSTVSQAVHDSLSNASGLLTNDYHHSPSSISLESCGSNMMSFTNGQGIGTQMIPTPGLSNSQSMLANANFTVGDQYLMRGNLESLNYLPYSVRSNTKQNSGSVAIPEKINPGINSLLPVRPLAMRQPTLTESHVCNVTRKRKLESACLHDEYGTEMHVSWHKLVELPRSHLIGGTDSRVVNNQQLMVKNDLINKAQPGFQSGNQNFFYCRMDHVGSHAQTFEQSQFTGSQVDFIDQRCLGNDYSKDDEMGENSVGSCGAHPSMPLEPLLQEHGEAAIPFSKHLQDDFRQRVTNLDEEQQPLSSVEDNSIIHKGRPVAKDSATHAFVNVEHERHRKQQRWLLLLRHAKKCSAPKGQCLLSYCSKAQEVLQHLCQCTNSTCAYPNCQSTKCLVIHHQRCRDPSCLVCIPVGWNIAWQHKARISDENVASLKKSLDGNRASLNCVNIPRMSQIKRAQVLGNPEEQKVLVERKKINHSSTDVVVKSDGFLGNPSCIRQYDPEEVTSSLHEQKALQMNAAGKESVQVKKGDYLLTRLPSNSILSEVEMKETENLNVQKPALNSSILGKSEAVVNEDEKQHNANELKLKQELAIKPTCPGTLTKTEKLKIMGVSLIELFTPEQVKEHVNSLLQWFGQSKAKAEKNQASRRVSNENSCQLCGVEKLIFQPPPIHCTKCGARIKRNSMYYTRGIEDTRNFICVRCFNEAACDYVNIAGDSIPKSELKKAPNSKKAEEGWVKCDDCDHWQHQICALFNNRQNGVQVEYTCPYCYIAAIERGEQKPLPKNAVMGAEDLPSTMVSDHIEQRLAKKLKQERHDRAKLAGKNFDEVPGAEGLVVRVVSSVDKRLEVKQRFLENFRVKNYPAEFAYKSKVILLFQKIEGVEVLLFGMYVQEFGSECPSPNQRRVYLSYLDSVKYFRPEIEAVTGEALRTVVYHEILIGYLEYCKARGFTSCYIWACPPLKGEDYIFYCHPEIQKTPKSDKLREWYLSMLRKATSENIVVEVTNFYDHFFTSAGECKAEITATRLPYFEGDYWPSAAEDMIIQLHQEESGKQLNDVKLRKCSNRRSSKTADSFNPACSDSKDTLLMQKLGESILPLKEDFIMVHLQKACSHCAHLMVFGKRWVCKNCKSFQLCDECYDNEQKLEEWERHPLNNREKHLLWPQEIMDVPADTKDGDEILDSEFLDTRQAFLSLCQGNYYQYDTLRRAKHSSMMVLYHLHNPAAPAFVSTCNICHLDIKTGQGWRCEVCPDFDVCSMCYQKDGKFEHPHILKNHPSVAEHDAQNQEARQQRLWQLQKMLDLLGHASQCRFTQCKYPNCVKVKSLFRHGIRCTIRASGGCGLCLSMWRLLKLHARACKKPECRVPRCKDLKEHMKRLLQQEDFRRGEEVMEMMRQRAAEMEMG